MMQGSAVSNVLILLSWEQELQDEWDTLYNWTPSFVEKEIIWKTTKLTEWFHISFFHEIRDIYSLPSTINMIIVIFSYLNSLDILDLWLVLTTKELRPVFASQ